MAVENHPLAVALSGGGAKSAAQAGVLDILDRSGVPVGFLSGASAGAVVAVMYALGLTPETIRDFIGETDLLDIWELDPARQGLFGAEKIRARMQKVVGESTFADLRLPVCVVAVDLNTGVEVKITSGRLDEALLATTAIPGLFTPLVRGDQRLIDGGALNPMPLDAARGSGRPVLAVDVLHHQPSPGVAVQLFEKRGPMGYAGEIASRMGLAAMMENIHQAAVIITRNTVDLNLRLWPPDVLIRPEVGSVGLFASDLAAWAYERGREACQAALPAVRAIAACPPKP